MLNRTGLDDRLKGKYQIPRGRNRQSERGIGEGKQTRVKVREVESRDEWRCVCVCRAKLH